MPLLAGSNVFGERRFVGSDASSGTVDRSARYLETALNDIFKKGVARIATTFGGGYRLIRHY